MKKIKKSRKTIAELEKLNKMTVESKAKIKEKKLNSENKKVEKN